MTQPQQMIVCNDCGSVRMAINAVLVNAPSKLSIAGATKLAVKPCPVCEVRNAMIAAAQEMEAEAAG